VSVAAAVVGLSLLVAAVLAVAVARGWLLFGAARRRRSSSDTRRRAPGDQVVRPVVPNSM
jgi:hypothetical protein